MVERHETQRILYDMFLQAQNGSGRAVLIAGAQGMGKTALIHKVQARAKASGGIVLTSLASKAERDLQMGVISQMLVAADLAPKQTTLLNSLSDGRLPPSAVADGVHRLAHRLAECAVLVITVDDVHEIDTSSLHCLLYLIRRMSGSRILVVLGECAKAPPVDSALTTEFVRNPQCRLVQLSRLSVECTASALAGLLSTEEVRDTVSCWHHASGGSPLLLQALLKDRGAVGTPESAGPVAGEAFKLAVRYLINQLDEVTLLTARGLAVLEASATLDNLDRLLGLPGGTASQTIETLSAIGLIEDGRYCAEAARSTVLEEMVPKERARLHHEVARLLYESRATSGAVARHLVVGGPLDESWTLPLLRDAADQALCNNDAEWTITCLRAAHDVCEDERQRAVVRAELAHAEWEVEPAAVRRNLTRLMEDHRRGYLNQRQSTRLIAYLLWHGRPEDADEVFADLNVVQKPLSEESKARLETISVWFAHSYPALGARDSHAFALGEMTLDRSVRAVNPQMDGALVLHTLMTDGPTSNVLKTAEQLLQSVVLHDPPVAPTIAALASFVHASQLDRVSDWCELLLQGAERQTPMARATFAAASAAVESWLGNFEVARQRADQALSLMSSTAWGVAIGVPLAAKVLACTAQGDYEEAADCFKVPVPEMMFQALPGLHYLQARGRYHLAMGRYHAALGDFHACRDLMAAWNLDVSSSLSWRAYAAEALIELGSPAQARELLVEELNQQGTHNRWVREQSLRMLERLDTVRQPVMKPEMVREFTATEERAIDRLSKAEQRVVRLAFQEYTNREIAAKLFVTTSTVEQHLTRIYHKLGVRGRGDLLAILGSGAIDH
ncbi:AAA family ATPase [Streptosporangium sp. NPDC000563]|uniref:helix-turn-helix transcriptional regulator n=1 Tax=Streptosporangium sp. NPDC000563 TaxID=3154366 RepID=UPI003328D857